VSDLPHEQEPSLEVQLPFLQTVLPDATLVPLVVGEVTDEEAAAVVHALWTDETLAVVSTDLSHYFDATTAARLDEQTARAVETLEGASLGQEQACGHAALRALLLVARARSLRVTRLALRVQEPNAPGALDEVIGFGTFALGDP
jgi:AmmeMemoRadiSam system protein B